MDDVTVLVVTGNVAVVAPAATVTLAGTGALIVSRHPGHRIGWLFIASALFVAVSADLAQGWGLRAAEQGWPGGPFGEWVALLSWAPSGIAIVLTFLLFPDGHLTRPGWQALAWLYILGAKPLVEVIIEHTGGGEMPNWALLLTSGPLVLVFLFGLVFWLARGLQALAFVKKYDVTVTPLRRLLPPEPADETELPLQGATLTGQ